MRAPPPPLPPPLKRGGVWAFLGQFPTELGACVGSFCPIREVSTVDNQQHAAERERSRGNEPHTIKMLNSNQRSHKVIWHSNNERRIGMKPSDNPDPSPQTLISLTAIMPSSFCHHKCRPGSQLETLFPRRPPPPRFIKWQQGRVE